MSNYIGNNDVECCSVIEEEGETQRSMLDRRYFVTNYYVHGCCGLRDYEVKDLIGWNRCYKNFTWYSDDDVQYDYCWRDDADD